MITKRILVIDNDSQDQTLIHLKSNARKIGIDLHYDQFNVGGAEEPDVLDLEGNIDINKAKSLYNERYNGVDFDLIACDWDLDNTIDGVELLRQLDTHCFKSTTPRMLYSSLLEETIESMINSVCADKNDNDDIIDEKKRKKQKVVKCICQLVKSKFVACVKRDYYENDILNYLSQDESLQSILDKAMKSIGDKHISNRMPTWMSGLSYNELLNELEDGSKRAQFKDEFIKQCISYQ